MARDWTHFSNIQFLPGAVAYLYDRYGIQCDSEGRITNRVNSEVGPILSEIIERLVMAQEAYVASNPGRCNMPCAHQLDLHDCEQCRLYVAFECVPVCKRCRDRGVACNCDPAHESDMRALRQEQLRQDIDPENCERSEAEEQDALASDGDWRERSSKQLEQFVAQDIEREFGDSERHEDYCVRRGRGSCIC